MIQLYVVLHSLFTERFRKDEGATAIEYVLLVVGIAIVVGIAAVTLGTAISTKFTSIATSL